MLHCAGIIAQAILAQANKKSFSTTMQGNYAGCAQSVVAVVDFLARPRLPVPGMPGSFRLGATERDRLARLAGE